LPPSVEGWATTRLPATGVRLVQRIGSFCYILRAMDSRTTARRVAEPINEFGARFMLDPATFARCAEEGMPLSLASYVHGRLGVMGEIDVDAAIESMLFFEPTLVENAWVEESGLTKAQSGTAYAAVCAERGRAYLDGFEGASRLSQLLEKVADSADDTNAALFAGWRDADRPDDPAGRAYLMLATIRELRGCLHMTASRKAGVDPLAMVLASGGEGTAQLHGYTDLDRKPASAEQLTAIEEATTDADAANYDCLTEDERTELAKLVEAAVVHAAER